MLNVCENQQLFNSYSKHNRTDMVTTCKTDSLISIRTQLFVLFVCLFGFFCPAGEFFTHIGDVTIANEEQQILTFTCK